MFWSRYTALYVSLYGFLERVDWLVEVIYCRTWVDALQIQAPSRDGRIQGEAVETLAKVNLK